MTQVTAMLIMFVLYGVLPAAGLYLGYRGIKKVTAPKMLEYEAMPQLGYIPEKSLPNEVKEALEQINKKGEKLCLIYGDTNNDGQIDDKDTVSETYIMIQNLMDRHIPQAVADYRRLHDLDGTRADTTKIKHSNVTGKEALLDVLGTVNVQFDDLLDASYHQDGQKLLVTNRYLQQRFDSPIAQDQARQSIDRLNSVSDTNNNRTIIIENPATIDDTANIKSIENVESIELTAHNTVDAADNSDLLVLKKPTTNKHKI